MTPELEDLVRRLRLPYGSCRKEAADVIEALATALDAANVNHGCRTCAADVGVLGAERAGLCSGHAEELAAALDAANAEKDAAIIVIESLRDMLRDARSVFQMPAETMVQLVTVAVCRKCGKPIEAGWFRFGSDQAGWEHMEGECPS